MFCAKKFQGRIDFTELNSKYSITSLFLLLFYVFHALPLQLFIMIQMKECCHLDNAIACLSLTAALEQLGLSFFFVCSFQPQMNNRVAFAKKKTGVGGLLCYIKITSLPKNAIAIYHKSAKTAIKSDCKPRISSLFLLTTVTAFLIVELRFITA